MDEDFKKLRSFIKVWDRFKRKCLQNYPEFYEDFAQEEFEEIQEKLEAELEYRKDFLNNF